MKAFKLLEAWLGLQVPAQNVLDIRAIEQQHQAQQALASSTASHSLQHLEMIWRPS